MPRTTVVRTEVVRTGGTTVSINPHVWILAIVLAIFAIIFALIALVTSGWGGRSIIGTAASSNTTTIVLCALAIILLVLGIITLVLFARRILITFSTVIKISSVILLMFGAIFLVATYLSVGGHQPKNYSYYLMATASVFAFVASIIASYWFGQNP